MDFTAQEKMIHDFLNALGVMYHEDIKIVSVDVTPDDLIEGQEYMVSNHYARAYLDGDPISFEWFTENDGGGFVDITVQAQGNATVRVPYTYLPQGPDFEYMAALVRREVRRRTWLHRAMVAQEARLAASVNA